MAERGEWRIWRHFTLETAAVVLARTEPTPAQPDALHGAGTDRWRRWRSSHGWPIGSDSLDFRAAAHGVIVVLFLAVAAAAAAVIDELPTGLLRVVPRRQAEVAAGCAPECHPDWYEAPEAWRASDGRRATIERVSPAAAPVAALASCELASRGSTDEPPCSRARSMPTHMTASSASST